MTSLEADDAKFAELPIGEIAVRLVGATAVFRKHKLDYCCGGTVSLIDAVAGRALDLVEVERELVGLIRQPLETPATTEAIIDHIVSRHHSAHRRDLPELIQLARRIEKIHANHPEAPKGLVEILEQINADLGAHMHNEETGLFPMMRTGYRMVGGALAAMRTEHMDHCAAIEDLSVLTRDMAAPQDACGSWMALYAGLRKFSDDLAEHIHIENNILFPRFVG